MAPTIRGGLGHGDASRLADHLLHLQQDNPGKSVAITGLAGLGGPRYAPERAPWRQELERLQPFEQDLALLPIGWGTDQKGPMLEGWQHHDGFTVAQLQAHRPKGVNHG